MVGKMTEDIELEKHQEHNKLSVTLSNVNFTVYRPQVILKTKYDNRRLKIPKDEISR